MCRRLLQALLTTALLLVTPPLLAWNAAGHRLVATIAWQELGAAERTAIGALLAAHPDVATWDKKIQTGDERDWVRFSEASTWADDIRHDPRFFDEGREPATPTLAGFPDMARRRTWHYVNLPLGEVQRPGPAGGELDRRLGKLAEILADPRAEITGRAYALVWLIHLVGDIHQPLHVATRHDAHGDDDAGGNGLAVIDPDNPRRPETNLHAWWDDLPGPPWLRGTRLLAVAQALRGRLPPTPTEVAGDAGRWRDESFRLARDVVYAGATELPLTISADYRRAAREIANERIAVAGRRLAAMLRQLLAVPPPRQ